MMHPLLLVGLILATYGLLIWIDAGKHPVQRRARKLTR